MKNIILTLSMITVVSLTNFKASAQEDIKTVKDKSICLQIVGVAVEKDVPLNGVQVTLLKENEEMEWNELSSIPYHDHSFSFNLQKDAYYTIQVSKPGYITRSISISTTIPDSILLAVNTFVFEFDVELFKIKKGVDDYYMDFPVAIISFNKNTELFENNERYTKHIKSRLKEAMYADGVTFDAVNKQ